VRIRAEYADTLSPGSGIVLWAVCERTILGADALGERGVPAERVGRAAAESLLQDWQSGATLDRYLADQVIPLLALFGGGFRCPELTDHVRTNLQIATQLTGARFQVEDRRIRCEP